MRKPSIKDIIKHDAIVTIHKDDYLRIATALKLIMRGLHDKSFYENDTSVKNKIRLQYEEYEETLKKIYKLIDTIFPLSDYEKY